MHNAMVYLMFQTKTFKLKKKKNEHLNKKNVMACNVIKI